MLYRNPDKGIVAGVALALAETYNLPAWYIRTLFIGLFFFFGVGFLAYLAAWALIPKQTGQTDLGLT